jgi:polyhydroxyalkanoate synthesis regulator phasin
MARKKTSETPDPTALVETAFLVGIGVLELTREKLGEMTDDLVERGKMSRSEAKKVGNKIGDMAKEQQDSVRKTVEKETERALNASGLATKKEVTSLRAEIADLKAMLADQKAGKKTARKPGAKPKAKAAAKKPASKPKAAAKKPKA